MKPINLHAKTIADAWFQLLYNIFDNSYRQDIQSGSFEGEQYRLQYPGASVYIEYPAVDMVPVIPDGLLDDNGNKIVSPTDEQFNLDYFTNYIMNPELAENETYKYASRINERMTTREGFVREQLAMVIDMLKKTPMTNQAVIEIAKPSDIATCYGNDGKLDPPCLRLIDFKVVPMPAHICDRNCNEYQHAECPGIEGPCQPAGSKLVLTVSVYFRSWDLWAGFPVNLAGIELLKQLVAAEAGLVNGPMYAYSAGLHIYGYQEKFARVRTMKAAQVGVK